MATPTRVSYKGYPNPGPQRISVEDILGFMTEKQWDECRTTRLFDYIVIGSSICCLSFVKKVLENQPDAKILIIERGEYFLPDHYQTLPKAYAPSVRASETFHWSITEDTHNGEYIKFQHGMQNFFGGRSIFWRGWCPEPTEDEMDEWPNEVIEKVRKYFPEAKSLLNVVPANKISSEKDAIFGKLQDLVYAKLQSARGEIEGLTRVEHAAMAVRADMYRKEDYHKYAVSSILIEHIASAKHKVKGTTETPALQVILNCTVEKILETNGVAEKLETSRGEFTLGKAKLILAMGALPPTTLMLNSFPSLEKIGERYTAHFVSSIIARVPVDSYREAQKIGELQMVAMYVAGKHPISRHQYHIQMNAFIDERPSDIVHNTKCHLPDASAVPTEDQLKSCKGYVLITCACLGQLDHKNPRNRYQRNKGGDITCNADLQCVTNETDRQLWDEMDKTTFEILENYLSPTKEIIQYWSKQKNDWDLTGKRPSPGETRKNGLVHGASTMWIGDDKTAPVDLDYRFRGVENVYLTGGALWPTGASWNPTCAMSALAMDLADKLTGHTEKLASKL